ncbi:calcium-binding protein [Microbacterium sp. 2FI]|uniref:calcium-binding protein n=1 Tax=Microbacterium sp. 2FI TaxID=2502193 RepID=UPI0010F89668|nr:calcium-binding protein [Microbacterium sp. 2FI]
MRAEATQNHVPKRRTAAIISAVTAWLLVSTALAPAAAQALVDEPNDVVSLRANLGALAEVFVGEYEEVGPLADPVPLSDTSPGADPLRPGDALDLAGVLKVGITDKLLAQQGTTATLEEFVAQVDTELDGTVGDSELAVEATAIVSDDDVSGFDLAIEVSRTLDGAIAVTDPSGPGGVPVRLVATAPFDLAFTFTASLRTSADGALFWLDTTAGEPEVGLTATLDHGGPFTFPSGTAAIGVADVEVLTGSTVDLDASWNGVVDDTNDDGRLAMVEPVLGGGGNTPGELTMPADQLTAFVPTGSAVADVRFGSALVGLGTSPSPALALDADLATAPDLVAELTGAADDLEDLAAFTRITPVDLVSGIVQYGTLLRSLQKHPNVDEVLPLTGGRLSDLYDLSSEFNALADSLITIEKIDADADPTDETVPDVVVVGITTVGDLADKLDDQITGVGAITPVYNPATQEVRLDLEVTRGLDGLAAIEPVLGDGSEVAQLAFGDQLLDQTGLRSVAKPGGTPPVQPQVDVAYDIDLPVLIDLAEAVPASDDLTTPVIEFEAPMVFERFRTELTDAAELEVTHLVDAGVDAAGQIGIVPVSIGGHFQLLQDGSDPTTAADVDPASGATSTPRITDLLGGIYEQEGQPPTHPVAVAARHAVVDVDLEVDGHGVDPAETLTDSPGTFAVDGTGFDPSTFTAGATNDEAELLRALDVDTSEPTRLLGRVIDSMGEVTDSIGALDGGLAAAGLDNPVVPFLNKGAQRLLEDVVDLQARYDEFRGGPTPVDLAGLESGLEAAFAQIPGETPDATFDVRFELVDTDAGPDVAGGLILRLSGGRERSVEVPLALDDASIPAISTSGGGILADLAAQLDLGVLVGLAPGNADVAPQILDSSRIAISAGIAESSPGAAELAVNLGPFSAQLGDADNATGRIALGVELGLGRTGAPAPGDDAEEPLALSDYFDTGLDLALGSSADGGSFTCDPGIAGLAPVVGTYGCAAMPVLADLGTGLKTIGGNDPATPDAGDYLQVKVDDLAAPDITAPANLDAIIQGLEFAFDGLTDGFSSLAQILDAAIAASTAGGHLPLIGEDLAQLADGLEQFKAYLENPPLDGMPGATVDSAVFGPNGLRDQLAAELSGIGILRDSDYAAVGTWGGDPAGDTTPNATDIRIVAVCNGVVCPAGALLTDLDDLTVELELGQGARGLGAAGTCAAGEGTECPGTVEIPFDLGLPGLPISLDGNVVAQAGWTIELGFGLSREDGFYLLDNPVPGTGVPDAEPGNGPEEIRVNVGASMGTEPISGHIGFIAMEATDQMPNGNASGARLIAQLGLDAPATCDTMADPYTLGLVGTYCTSRILLTDLLTGDPSRFVASPRLSGDITLGVGITTGIASGSAVNKTLPTFTADFSFAWGFTDAGFGDPVIALRDISVAPGQIFERMFGKVLDELTPILEPTKPVREFLFSPIPVISDLSEFFDGPPVTMVDLAKLAGFVDVELLKDLDTLLDFLDTVRDLSTTGEIVLVDELLFDPAAAQGPPKTPDQVSELWGGTDPVDPNLDLMDEVGQAIDAAAPAPLAAGDSPSEAWEGLGEGSAGDGASDFTYPVFENPGCLVEVLLGNDCAIVEWRPDLLNVHMEYSMSFGPFFGVLYLTIGGELDAKAQVGAGVSTRGIRLLGEQLLEDGTSDFDAGSVGKLFVQSLYLTDLDREQKDVPEFTVSGTIKAGAKFDALIVAAGVDGGITATFGLNLDDRPQADGRMYIDEIIAKINTPICLFVIEGKLIAFLEVWARFGVCPFCYSDTWRLAEVTLFEFSSSCDTSPPDLATPDGDAVKLNVGSRAVHRGSLTEITAEAYVVRQLTAVPDGDGNHRFSISAFGYTEEETGKRIVIENAAGDDDSFAFLGGGDGAQMQSGTDGGNAWPFTAPIDANLGTGDDTLIAGSGDDLVAGDGGSDVINLGDGANQGWGDQRDGGGDGIDALAGGDDVDKIWGGPSGDTIDGGLGADELFGEAGNDKVSGGDDHLVVPAGEDAPDNAAATNRLDVGDLIVGGADFDTLVGGSGDDRIYGDQQYADGTAISDESPAAAAGDANDLIEGSGGSDTIFGGGGEDEIHGGFKLAVAGVDDSPDHLQGNTGNDRLYGSGGDDDLWGGPDADRIWGDDGDDDGHGQSGDDPEVRGGPGSDQLWGGGGADALFGDDGADELIGDGDGAAGAGTTGADTADGGSGDDIVLGDDGTIGGSPGARVPAPSETDGVGDPSLGGGEGADRIYGEGGDDFAYGGGGDDLVHGNGGTDELHGETGDDEVWGDADADLGFGGTGDDVVLGNAANDVLHGQEGIDLVVGGNLSTSGADTGDEMYGGPDHDRAFGDDVTVAIGLNGQLDALDAVSIEPSNDVSTYGDDVADGGTGRDEVHGQDGDDLLYGAEDYDQVFGELGDDRLIGGAGPDDLVGDQGTIAPAARVVATPSGGWLPGTPAGSPDTVIQLVAPGLGGEDLIWGDFDTADAPWPAGGDDRGFGGQGTDTLRGGAHDDHLEGNAGQDRIFGFDEDSTNATDGADDLIGGSSPVNPLANPDGANLAPDAGEVEMQGNGDDDVMTGDNAVLTRVADGDEWAVDPVTGGVLREVTLLDTEKADVLLALVSGGDFMVGNGDPDRMFGEGGNDLVKGNAGDDLVEGNQGGDWLEGNGNEDDLIGGSSFPDQRDSGDVLWGGGGADVLAGDNACIVRDVPGVDFEPESCPALDTPAPSDFHYVTSQLGVQTPRGLIYHDLDGPVSSEFGMDVLNGGSAVDAEFGQDASDFLFGDSGADFQHGNGGADVVVGDRPYTDYAGILLPPEVGGTLPALPTLPAGLPGVPSMGVELVGTPQPDGQDDQFGGSNLAGHRDSGDWLFGDGEADFQLGDNGELNRTVEDGAYAVYEERYPGNEAPADGSGVIEREVVRYDVGASAGAGVWGADLIFGGNGTNPLISADAGDGDDSQWGQDGDDRLFGEDGDDDQYGELGADTMWGGDGEDAMVGDRGGVQTRFVEIDGSDAGDPDIVTHTSQGPPGINLGGPDSGAQDAVLHPFEAHPLYRGTSLSHDRDGSVLTLNGHDAGGADRMRGGPGHDSLHGGEGADLMNGDSGGDYVYGDDGADAMWGGRGNPTLTVPDLPSRNDPGSDGQWIDVLFGGRGLNATEAGADILDYQPRAGIDAPAWFTLVSPYADTAPENTGAETRQHHHGTDWIYGGWDRDVLQGDVAANGPNDGDKLLDWSGAYNLYTHCNSAYGGWNDVRKPDPNNLAGLEKLAYVTGARTDFDGAPTLADVQASNGSAYREVAIVYTKDVKNNTGKAFSGTPGHFQDFICTSD